MISLLLDVVLHREGCLFFFDLVGDCRCGAPRTPPFLPNLWPHVSEQPYGLLPRGVEKEEEVDEQRERIGRSQRHDCCTENEIHFSPDVRRAPLKRAGRNTREKDGEKSLELAAKNKMRFALELLRTTELRSLGLLRAVSDILAVE